MTIRAKVSQETINNLIKIEEDINRALAAIGESPMERLWRIVPTHEQTTNLLGDLSTTTSE